MRCGCRWCSGSGRRREQGGDDQDDECSRGEEQVWAEGVCYHVYCMCIYLLESCLWIWDIIHMADEIGQKNRTTNHTSQPHSTTLPHRHQPARPGHPPTSAPSPPDSRSAYTPSRSANASPPPSTRPRTRPTMPSRPPRRRRRVCCVCRPRIHLCALHLHRYPYPWAEVGVDLRG